ncbi:uncharacterized protein Z518_03850 [Rhinocladiella mackenziei CBS 650.93]|uniref:NACHT-NTPase and P-loop NTPases N-terminal domain-containing protein n=1 Tax=Rhinocladiella mackenziei CBS 650.93 TaxID=1442369 RepID=A0A0D2FUW4_9EURO|nr:uncharacterized protein Z518_03850 [Rhinocladiella mackenziei CBS 650.93]KIX05877.1 hypothetical protein Z518_03850 [Rhinocladiella mackenziei CBS 650.93]
MEALGAAASIATIIEVLQLAVELRHRFKDAPAEFNRLAIHIGLLAVEFELLVEAQQDRLNLPDNCVIMFDQCARSLKDIKRDLASSPRSGFGKQVHWVWLGRERSRVLLQELTQLEVSIGVILQLLHWKQSQESAQMMKELIKPRFSHISNHVRQEPDALLPPRLLEDSHPCLPVHISGPQPIGPRSRSQVAQSVLFRFIQWAWLVAYTDARPNPLTVASLQVNIRNWIGIKLEITLRTWAHNRFAKLQINRILMSMVFKVPLDQPFMTACSRGDIVSVRTALQEDPAGTTYYSEGGVTPLSLAIDGGHFEVCKLLLENGVDANSAFGEKQTSALSWALRHRQMKIARLFIQYGASFHHLSLWGWSPIFYLWSTTSPHPSAKEFLQLLCSTDEFVWLHHGLTDVEGWSLLSRCAIYGTLEDVMMLIKLHVDPFQREPDSEWTVLHNAIWYGVENVYFALFPLFQKKLGIEIPDSRGWTLLHLAIASGKDTIIRHLLENGADWRVKTSPAVDYMPESIRGISVSSVQIAAAYGDKRYIEYLDVLYHVLDREQEELDQGKDDWFDAI